MTSRSSSEDRSRQGTTDLLTADGWRVELDRTGDELVVRYQPDDGPTHESKARAVDDGDHRILVTLDPVRHLIIAEIDGAEALRALGAALPDAAAPGHAWEAQPNATPLCDRLVERLEENAGPRLS